MTDKTSCDKFNFNDVDKQLQAILTSIRDTQICKSLDAKSHKELLKVLKTVNEISVELELCSTKELEKKQNEDNKTFQHRRYLDDKLKHPEKMYVFKKNEFDCKIKRSGYSGSWNGYIKIPSDHKYYLKHYDNISVSSQELTYSKKENSNWWIGFDHGHMIDFQPTVFEKLGGTKFESLLNMDSFFGEPTYTTYEMIEQELEVLTEELLFAK
jgi:hypothetical protein